MRTGSLVRFTVAAYHDWGLGLVLRPYDEVDREGRRSPGYYHVFTQAGEKVVSKFFMEEIKC